MIERAILYDIRARPRVMKCNTGTAGKYLCKVYKWSMSLSDSCTNLKRIRFSQSTETLDRTGMVVFFLPSLTKYWDQLLLNTLLLSSLINVNLSLIRSVKDFKLDYLISILFLTILLSLNSISVKSTRRPLKRSRLLNNKLSALNSSLRRLSKRSSPKLFGQKEKPRPSKMLEWDSELALPILILCVSRLPLMLLRFSAALVAESSSKLILCYSIFNSLLSNQNKA